MVDGALDGLFSGAGVAAPAGLQQQKATQQLTPDSALGTLFSGAGAERWQTGGQAGSTANGWNTPFYEKFFAQQKQYADAGKANEQFDDDHFTGIVTWDQKAKKAGRSDYTFGDVYQDGVHVGNLYDKSSGYNPAEADTMMSGLLWDRTTQQQHFQAARTDPNALATAVQQERETRTKAVEQHATAQDYAQRVAKLDKSWDGTTEAVAATAGGAVGGGALGAGIGTVILPGVGTVVGGVIGTVAGGIGGYLNQDELSDQAARVTVQTDLASRNNDFSKAADNIGAGFTTAVAGWAGLASKAISPLSNIVHGAYDAGTKGGIGDDSAGWYQDVDPNTGQTHRNGFWTGADIVAGFGDSVAQFTSPLGQTLFLSQMGTQVGGSVAQLAATGGSTFDDRRGRFDNIFTDDKGNVDLLSGAAGLANIGIDAVQMLGGGGLVKAARSAAGQEAGIFSKIFRKNDGLETHTEGGRTFKLDDNGVAVDQHWSVAALAPSEMIQGMSARVLAWRNALKRANGVEGQVVVSADDIYRATLQLANGTMPIRQALVNAVGEGTEEAAQAFLEPISHNQAVDGNDVFESFLRGAAMGAGMTAGTKMASKLAGSRAVSDVKLFHEANLSRGLRSQAPLSRDEWNKMSRLDRARESSLGPLQKEQARAALQSLATAQNTSLVKAQPALAKYVDAVQAVRDQTEASATVKTDNAYRITQLEDADHPNHVVGSSLNTLRANLHRHVEGMQVERPRLEADAASADPDVAAAAQVKLDRMNATVAAAQPIVDFVDLSVTHFNDALKTRSTPLARAILQGVNTRLQQAWADPAEARAVSLVFVRDPQDQAGSYLALLPQVSEKLSLSREGDFMLQVSHGVLQSIGGDFDGDKIRQQAQLALDDEAFSNLRIGMGLLGANTAGVNIMERHYEATTIGVLAETLQDTSTAVGLNAAKTLDNITDAITSRYTGIIPDAQLSQILDKFKQDVRLGDTDARANMINAFATQHGQAITDFARTQLSNEWLLLDQVVQQNLQRFQTNYAGRATALGAVSATPANPVQMSTNYREVRHTQAVNDAVNLFIRAEGYTPFRMSQKVHYSSDNSPVDGAGINVQELAELTAWYELIGQGMTQSALDQLDAADQVTARVLYQLNRVVTSMVAEGSVAPEGALGLVANLQMPEFDSTGRPLPGPTTLLQVLLRRENEQARAQIAPVVKDMPELDKPFAARDSLTKPGRSEAAFIEVLGQQPLYLLLGEASEVLGSSLTLEQALRKYTSQHEDLRAETKRQLQSEPEYVNDSAKSIPYRADEVAAGKVSAFAATVDAIIGAGNKRISMVAKGENRGLANGELGDVGVDGHTKGASFRKHRELLEAFELSRAAFHEEGNLTGRDPLHNLDDLQSILNEDPVGWSRAVLDLIPNASANGVFEIRDGQLYMADWVLQMLQMDPEAAAMHYWRNIKIAAWNSLGSRHTAEDEEPGRQARAYDQLTDRIHQKMYELRSRDDGGLSFLQFEHDLATATNLPEFIKLVNTKYRGNEAPYTAWYNDAADFDVNKAKGGWSSVIEGSEQRGAIASFKAKSERLFKAMRQEESDLEAVRRALNGYAKKDATDAERKYARHLDDALAFAAKNQTAVGPNQMLYQSVQSALGFPAQAHTKGIAPKPYVAQGAVDLIGNEFGYKPAFSSHEQAANTIDLGDVVQHMAMLARGGVRTMDETTGLPIEFEPLDGQKVAELYLNRPELRSAIKTIITPQVFERTPSGDVSLQLLTKPALKELLDGQLHDRFFREDHSSRMLYNAQVNARAAAHGGEYTLQSIADDVITARLTGMDMTLRGERAERLTAEVYDQIASILRRSAEVLELGNAWTDPVTGQPTTALEYVKRKVREELRSRFLHSKLQVTADENIENAITGAVETRKQAVLDAEKALALANTRSEIAEADRVVKYEQAQLKRFEETLELLKSDSPIKHLAMAYAIDWDVPADAEAKKAAIVQYVRSHGTELRSRAQWAKAELAALDAAWFDQSKRDAVTDMPILHVNEGTAQKMWDTLSRAAIAVEMDRMASFSAAGVSTPELESIAPDSMARYYDPTFAYLLDDILDPAKPALKGASEILAESGRTPTDLDVDGLIRHILNTLYADFNFGGWTSDVPMQSVLSRMRLESSAAGDSVSAYGMAPPNEVTESVATASDWTVPPAGLDSAITLTMDQVLQGDTAELIPFELVPNQVEGRMPLSQLNGRFASRVWMTLPGATAPVDLLSDPAFELGWTLNEASRNSGYQAINLARLRHALDAQLTGVVDSSQVVITVEFLHPDRQPEGMANNRFFEGVSFELPGWMQPSLNAELWFVDEGISRKGQQRALNATKGGTRAYLVNKTMPRDERDRIESSWMTDLSSVITGKTLWLMNNDSGDGRLEESMFNAVHKRQKMRHFVQGVDAQTGEVVLWSAEQVIRWQAEHPGQSIIVALQQARLWIPSNSALRTLLGEVGARGATRLPSGELTIDPTRVPAWTGDATGRATEVYPELMALRDGKLPVGDLWNTQAAARSYLAQVSVRPPMDDAARSQFERGVQYAYNHYRAVHEARRNEVNGKDLVQQGQQILTEWGGKIAQESVPFDAAKAGMPGLMARNAFDPLLSAKQMAELKEIQKVDGWSTAWVLQLTRPGEMPAHSPSEGYLSQTELDPDAAGYRPQPTSGQIATRDVAVLDVASAQNAAPNDPDRQFAQATKVLGIPMGARATIVLADNGSGGDLRGDLAWYLSQNGYEPAAGSRNIWVPQESESRYANQQARARTLVETHAFTWQDHMIGFLAEGSGFDENSAGLVKKATHRSVAVTMDLVPTNALVDFGVPVAKADREIVKQQIRALLEDPQGWDFLLAQSGIEDNPADEIELKRAFDRLVAHWDANDDSPSIVPVSGRWGTGDIVPLYNPRTRSLVLYRHGHEAPSHLERAQQLNAKLHPTDDQPVGIALYKPKLHKDATTHEGELEGFNLRGKYGMQVKLRIPLQAFGDKWQLEGDGMKYVLTPLSDKNVLLPEHNLFGDWGIDYVSDVASADSKQAYKGMVDNHRNAFAMFGIDFMPELVRAFFGPDAKHDDPKLGAQYQAWIRNYLGKIRRSQQLTPSRVEELLSQPTTNAEIARIIGSLELPDTGNLSLASSWQNDIANAISPEAQIALATMLYMTTPTARLEHVLRVGGANNTDVRSSDGKSWFMPELFTNVFDRAPIGSELRTLVFDKLNSQINNAAAKGSARYVLRQDFLFQTVDESGKRRHQGYLKFNEVHSSGDNPVLDRMAAARSSKQKVSPHATAVAFQAIAAETSRLHKELTNGGLDDGLGRLQRFHAERSSEGVQPIDTPESIAALLGDIPVDDPTAPNWATKTASEQHYLGLAHEVVGTFRQLLDRAEWTDAESAAYDTGAREVIAALGLKPNQVGLVDYWIRQVLGEPHGEGFEGRIAGSWAIDTIKEDILPNVLRGLLPTWGGEVAQLHRTDLQLIQRANRDPNQARFKLREKPGGKPVYDWDAYTSVALAMGDVSQANFDRFYLTATDGFLHTYLDDGPRLAGLPISRDVLRQSQLMDPETDRLLLSVNPNRNIINAATGAIDPDRQTLLEIFGTERIGHRTAAQAAPASVRSKRRAATRKARKEMGLADGKKTSLANYREQGDRFIHESTTNHSFLRIGTDLRATLGIFNPQLWASSIVEVMRMALIEDGSNLLMGESTGALGGVAAKLGLSRYTPAEIKQFHRLYEDLGRSPRFKQMAYKTLMYEREKLSNAGAIERFSAGLARGVAHMSDAAYGFRATALARRYMEGVLSYILTNPSEANVTPEQLYAEMATDPEWVEKNLPYAHAAGNRSVEGIRSLKATVLSKTVKSIYEPLSSNPNPLIGVPSTMLLKWPMLFSNFMFNVMTTVTGAQAANQLTALFLDGRKKSGLIRRAQSIMAGIPLEDVSERFDMSDVLDGLDISKSFVQSGLTLTAVFMTGFQAMGLGLSGESEEDRRRRRAAAFQGAGYVYDPRKVENDFRDQDTLFLDNVPFLGTIFKSASDGGPNAGRSMVQMNWMLKQFISPMMGMERWFETGDARQLLWGFQDAVGAFPLINQNTWFSAVDTYNELMSSAQQAEQEGAAGPDTQPAAWYFTVSAVGALERMLMESSFVNMVRNGIDQYDRDPWVVPMPANAEGGIARDNLGLPRPTQAMETYTDPDTGEVKQGYITRDWMDGQMHTLAEGRGTLALLMNLFTGQGPDGSFSRNNMAAKERTVTKPTLSQEQAEGLVLSVFDNAGGRETVTDDKGVTKSYEVLTENGARAVFDGLYHQTVELGSPALEGVYITKEMRNTIQTKWMAELVQEGVDAGLTEAKAKSRMYRLWNGPSDQPDVLGLRDILWSKKIPYNKDVKYVQLNTTYVMGPDGKPWATGATRDGLYNAFGFIPVNRYYGGGDVGNLGQDGRMNSVDAALNVNTGMRGLIRADQNPPPTDAEIGKSIEDALKDVMSQAFSQSGNGTKYYGTSRGGYGYRSGGGGGGYAYRINSPVRDDSTYGRQTPYIRVDNPLIRRSTIRRERFDSTRGRLTQWQ